MSHIKDIEIIKLVVRAGGFGDKVEVDRYSDSEIQYDITDMDCEIVAVSTDGVVKYYPAYYVEYPATRWEPPDGDYVEIGEYNNVGDAAKALVLEMIERRIDGELSFIPWELM